jgi:hypothetical protein
VNADVPALGGVWNDEKLAGKTLTVSVPLLVKPETTNVGGDTGAVPLTALATALVVVNTPAGPVKDTGTEEVAAVKG